MQTRKSFNDNYAFGRIAEGLIARWLMREGWSLLPAYEIEIPSGKGPRLFAVGEELVAPDILAMKRARKKFIFQWHEAKHKTRFTWRYSDAKKWQTGIDLRHYLDYIKVQEQTVDVRILFLHSSAIPSQFDLEHGAPSSCPTGLYGQSLRYLMEHEHHRDRYDKYGREYPMVYWNEDDLIRLATLQEVRTTPLSLWNGVPA